MLKRVLIGSIIGLLSCKENRLNELGVEMQIMEAELQKEEIICPIVYHYPQFAGGDAALLEFIFKNMRHPDEGIEGKVFLTFIVEVDGTLSNIQVVKGTSERFNEEAVRLAKLLPAFEPGSINGAPTRTKMLLPIHFKL